jgi:heme oxygenase
MKTMKKKAKKITKEMLAEFAKGIKEWKLDNNTTFQKMELESDLKEEKKMRKAYAADRKDLRVVYGFIVDGEYEMAGKYADNLDTIVRELIPLDIWEIIVN